MSPPPQSYGFGLPPSQNPQGRPPPSSRPPGTPGPGRLSSADATLFPLFKAVDKNGTGQLSEEELKVALVNGDWTTFDPRTVKMMIRMFDADKSGTIGYDEFWCLPLPFFTLYESLVSNDNTETFPFDVVAAYGISSPRGEPFSIALMKTEVATSPLMNTLKP